MAFSGSQITRLSLSAITRALYGLFTGKAESVGAPEIIESFTSILNTKGVSMLSTITTTTTSMTSTITETESMTSILNDRRTSLESAIDESGVSMSTEL